MQKKIINIFFYTITLVIVGILSSCNDLPTDMGSQILSDTTVIKTISSVNSPIIDSTGYYYYNSFTFTAETGLMGRSQGIHAPFLCTFNKPNDSLRNIPVDRIIEAELIMYYEPYCIGDYQSSLLEFDVNTMAKYWVKIEIDSVPATTYDSLFVSPADYFGEKIGSWSGQLDFDDSLNKPIISIPIETSYASAMFDYDEEDSTRITNHGLALLPTDACSIIQQFRTTITGYSSDSVSHLRIIFENDLGERDSVKLNVSLDGMYSKSEINETSENLYLQTNVDYRSIVKLNLTDIPSFAGIIKSELQLTLNKELCIVSNQGLDSVIKLGVFQTRDTYSPFADYVSATALKDSADPTKYKFSNLSGPIENIVRNGGDGELIVYPIYYAKDDGLNHNRIDRMVFYGNDAEDPDKRPILKIAYSYIEVKK